MRGIGLAQLSQMFPDLANRPAIFEGLLRILQVQQPDLFILPEDQRQQGQQPDPHLLQAQIKQGIAQLQAQIKQMDMASKERLQGQDAQSDQKLALINQQTEQIKSEGQIKAGLLRQHDSAVEQSRDHAHDLEVQRRDQIHEHVQNTQDRAHEQHLASLSEPTPKRKF